MNPLVQVALDPAVSFTIDGEGFSFSSNHMYQICDAKQIQEGKGVDDASDEREGLGFSGTMASIKAPASDAPVVWMTCIATFRYRISFAEMFAEPAKVTPEMEALGQKPADALQGSRDVHLAFQSFVQVVRAGARPRAESRGASAHDVIAQGRKFRTTLVQKGLSNAAVQSLLANKKDKGKPASVFARKEQLSAKELHEIRLKERERITALMKDKSSAASSAAGWFIMDNIWLEKWKKFVGGGAHALAARTALSLRDGNVHTPIAADIERPDGISNWRLLNSDGTPKPGLIKAKHYRGASRSLARSSLALPPARADSLVAPRSGEGAAVEGVLRIVRRWPGANAQGAAAALHRWGQSHSHTCLCVRVCARVAQEPDLYQG